MCFACCLSKGFTPFKMYIAESALGFTPTIIRERMQSSTALTWSYRRMTCTACKLLNSLTQRSLLLTWLAAMGELFFTHSSTILTTARRILGSADFSISEVRMTWMKFFLMSMLMTERRVLTRSRLSITSSLVTMKTETLNSQKSKWNTWSAKKQSWLYAVFVLILLEVFV